MTTEERAELCQGESVCLSVCVCVCLIKRCRDEPPHSLSSLTEQTAPRMKLCLLLAFSVLLLHKGKGAPRTAVYNFVKCNPESDQANCVTHQTPEMEWSPDIPSKLPSSSAQFLNAEPVEGESPPREEDEEEEEEEEETPMVDDKGESPVNDDGSGFEGSGFDDKFMADRAFERETGSGESWTEELSKGEGTGRFDEGKPEEQELREDHLLQL